MAGDEENGRRWFIGIVVAIAGIVVSSLVTLAAADRLHCPQLFCRPATPATSTVDEPAVLSLAPAQGPIRTQVALTLTGFGPNEGVTITFGGNHVAHFDMDRTGAARGISITVPDSFASLGDQVMTLDAEGDQSGRVATATFHLLVA